ncbi:MAG: 4-hydroxy-3-methylbut-2-enyl diphosphate reductase [Lachnospiraceae bacterium]|nr:4-hydroxy-3-methylbut-2-enyl diphosphate reductase [Lachnospiraceae bacterium]
MSDREVILAEHAGFCFGVKRAVEILDSLLDNSEGKRIFTWGPIIHNDAVVNEYMERGAVPIDEDEGLPKDTSDGIVVIRSHGVSKSVYDKIRDAGYEIADATCPFVKRIHRLVSEASEEGRSVIVIGDAGHPEVRGIVGWAGGDVTVIGSVSEAGQLVRDPEKRVTVVSQTTFRRQKFQEIVEIIRQKEYDMNIVDTICNATGERQSEAEQLAGEVDAMLVVGDSRSSNSRKLYEICSRICPHTVFVHSPEDLKETLSPGFKRVGITAGASTPQKIIEEVFNYARSGQQELFGNGG